MGEEKETFRVIRNDNNDEQEIATELEVLSAQEVFDEEVLSKVFEIKNEFLRQKVIMTLEQKAKSINQTRNFQKLLKVVRSKFMSPKQSTEASFGVTIKELELSLNTGEWVVDNLGVRRYVEKGDTLIEEQASWQMVVISNIYCNTELNTYRVQLAFKENEFSRLKTITVNKSVISSSANITCLADYGLSVTNHSAPFLVKYLNDLERLNVDKIPHSDSISRLGWINEYGFIPYTDDISFDGETIYGELYNAVECKGSYEEWKRMVLGEQGLEARVALASSFASPLVSIMDGLCFFTHLWGSSGTGKSVSLHLAQSVWGNPMKLVQNLNSTAVGLERLAGFFCNLPLCLDELQTLKKTFGGNSYDEILYKLGQGKGKNRGRKDGSIERVPSWAMTFITTGEEPITNEKSGAGAKNRVLDMYCCGNIFNNAPNVAKISHQNYGFAGKDYIAKLKEFITKNSIKPLNELYDKFYNKMLQEKVTEKQAMSATMITLGYCLMKHFIFDEDFNNIDNMYQDLMSYVAQNKHHFLYTDNGGIVHNPVEERIDTWGKISSSQTYISNNVFRDYCDQINNSYRKVARMLIDKGYINASNDKNLTIPVRINNCLVRCVVIKNDTSKDNLDNQIKLQELNSDLIEIEDNGTLPF